MCEWALSCLTLCDPQGPPSMGFYRLVYWSGLPFPLPGDFPKPGIEPGASCIAGGVFITSVTCK